MLARHGLRPGPQAVAAVHRRLSGWAAGLRLLALAARRSEDAEAYLKRIDAEQAAVSDFLLAEVLRAQPPATQDLLLCCSLLARVHPDLADALTGRRDGRAVLERLHRANAFTEALPDGWYRLHPMFGGILRLHLRATAPERIDLLHLRAAHWLAAHGRYRAALDHAAEGGAWGLAAQLLVDQLAVGELFTGRDAARLRALFAGMPPGVREPAAELVRAAVHLAEQDAGTALRVLERAEPGLPPEVPAQLAAAFLRADAGRLLGSAALADRAARRAHELAHRAPPGPLARHPELLPLVDADRGSALLWQGRLTEAGQALDAAARVPASPATAELRHDALCRLALIDCLRGWPGRAERRVRAADREAERASLPPDSRTEVADLVLAAAALERDEPAGARAALDRLAAAPGRDPVVALGSAVVRAELHLAQRQPAAALAVLAEVRDTVGRRSAWGRERLAVTACAAHLAAGRPQAAVAALDGVPTSAPDSVVVAARARLAAGRDRRRTLVQLRALRADPAVGSATRARALLLLAQAEPGPEAADGLRLLAEALAAARPERLRRPFRESAGWVRRGLRRRPELAREHPWLPADLLPAEAAAPQPVERLTAREREVLGCAARMLSVQEIAEELVVSPNTVKTHLKSINRKLATGSRREAVRAAERLHLLEED
ncbi:LuxR C-terminal-related transcriptional regulator [Kitasatospora sp. NPDC006697]|uniref:LuxR C-terminal-related transcriptional regulator n=1 Tax=Kitasatospora sp. NPDC006697 TaxID=3364020 RepID=UPI00367E0AA9